MLFQTLRITRRLQDELEQIQKRGRVSGLLAHGIEKRSCPSVAIRGGSSRPFLIELHAFPAVVDSGPKFPARLGPEYDHQHAPTVTLGLIAIEFDKTILPVGQIVSASDGRRSGFAGCQLGESVHKRDHRSPVHVCGKSGCRCKDPKNPQKHGPYFQLSFTWRGKSRTRFVRAERLAGVREKIANYKRFRDLTDEWVDLVVELEQQEREQAQ
jgi:hypothetical protein